MDEDHSAIPLPVGTIIGGKYALARVIGSGGMGAVYEAHNSWTSRRVAIKVLLAEHARRPEVIDRFTQEARATTQIAHPNIVDILDMGQDPASGALFIVQEFLDGMDLSQWLEQHGPYTPSEALAILMPVMGALVAAHRRGVIHRDLKPENIFLARNAGGVLVPKLIDFGISKFIDQSNQERSRTQTGMAVGTPQYMSPEQARGDRDVDARSDVWSIGVVLYEMLSGRSVFDAPNYNLLIVQVITQAPPRIETVAPGIPGALADALHRALEPDRQRRFQSMQEFLGALIASAENGFSREMNGAASLLDHRAVDATHGGLEYDDNVATRVEAPPSREHLDALRAEDHRLTLGGSQPTLTPPPWSGAAERSQPSTNLAPRIAVLMLVVSVVVAGIIGGFMVGSNRGRPPASATLPVTHMASPRPSNPTALGVVTVPTAQVDASLTRAADAPVLARDPAGVAAARSLTPAQRVNAPSVGATASTAQNPRLAAPRRPTSRPAPRPLRPPMIWPSPPSARDPNLPTVMPVRRPTNNAPILGVD